MTSVALLTPTYARDLELCTLLCESVDRHVTSFDKHYLLVPDSDYDLFSRFISDRRTVIPASAFLPAWLRPMPRMFQRKRRQFWWSMRAKPVSGWHVQQFLKIAAAMALPHERYCILDSDIVFFRDFDLARYRGAEHAAAVPRHQRGHRRPGQPFALGCDQPSAARASRAAAAGAGLYRPHHLLGSRHDARDGVADREP